MKKRILSSALIISMLICFASCGRVSMDSETAAGSTSAATGTESQTTAVTLTEETTETGVSEETTSETETTARKETSSSASTSAKATEKTTAQKVSETAATVATTLKKVTTSVSYTGKTTTETKTYVSDLKYGVDKRRTVVITYGYYSNGNKFVVSEEEKSVTYDRSTYSASYSDLLPGANQNRQTYASYINEVLRLTNEMRAEKGIAPLTLSSKLTEQANVRAEEVAWAGAKAHGHIRPNTRSYTSIFEENGYTTGTVGENVGWGYSTPAAVCAAWKASETHYENIMNPEFKSIGIGVAADPDPAGNLCWVQHFYSA